MATRLTLLALIWTLAVPLVFAQSRVPDLSQVAIEDLMNIEITSASRKEQRAADVAGRGLCHHAEDIRRSGMTTCPTAAAGARRRGRADQLEQVGGGDARLQCPVREQAARAGRRPDRLQPVFSGVLWDTEDLPIDDIDASKSIRGPGGAMWGANAVNGVINIVTKAAADTQGGAVSVGGGTRDAWIGRRATAARWSRRLPRCIRNGPIASIADRRQHARPTTVPTARRTGFRPDWAHQR